MKKRTLDQATKEIILEEIKNGLRVVSAGEKYNISTKTIYGWMKRTADNTGTSPLEIARLRRENKDLKEIIGMMTLKDERGKKNK